MVYLLWKIMMETRLHLKTNLTKTANFTSSSPWQLKHAWTGKIGWALHIINSERQFVQEKLVAQANPKRTVLVHVNFVFHVLRRSLMHLSLTLFLGNQRNTTSPNEHQ